MKIIGKTFLALVNVFIVGGNQTASAGSFNASDGAVIDYEVVGSGEPLLLLHSGMMSREDMRIQIDHFSKIYKVIAIDSREQGRSSPSSSQISYELMASDAIGVLDQLNIEKTHVFGQSDGGITALLLSFYYPERVMKSVIHGAVYNHSAYPEEQKQSWKNISWNKDNDADNDPEGFPGMAIEHYLLGRNDLTEFEAHLKKMSMMWATSPNLSKEDLSTIKTPTLVIVGDHYDISIRHSLEMHETLPNSELFVVPGATHFVHHEKPDLLHNVINCFLKQK